ncbi:MAG: VWA domain-containing protein, partial [Actinobacteria bacterium]|nr:VWA domain-containing protein [Actinomycetota bacterium]
MSFLWPWLLWGLILIPVFVIAYLAWNGRRARYATRFASAAMAPNVLPRPPGWRRHVPVALYLLGLAALLVGLSRPQAALGVPRERATIVFAIDSSRSMEAKDVAPNRLEAARRAAVGLVNSLPDRFQIGVVTFADKGKALTRPTTDRVAVLRALNSLDSLERKSGTAIGEGMARGLEIGAPASSDPGGNESKVPTVMLLLSDGNNTTGREPDVIAERARRQDVRIHSIALGVSGNADPNQRPRPPDVETLQQVAERTGGTFFAAPSGSDLRAVYEDLG